MFTAGTLAFGLMKACVLVMSAAEARTVTMELVGSVFDKVKVVCARPLALVIVSVVLRVPSPVVTVNVTGIPSKPNPFSSLAVM